MVLSVGEDLGRLYMKRREVNIIDDSGKQLGDYLKIALAVRSLHYCHCCILKIEEMAKDPRAGWNRSGTFRWIQLETNEAENVEDIGLNENQRQESIEKFVDKIRKRHCYATG